MNKAKKLSIIALALAAATIFTACGPAAPSVSPDPNGIKAEIEIGSRRYEEYTDRLIPARNYGKLIPYAGCRDERAWSDAPDAEDYEPYLYGLMTTDGEVITDPVYTRIARPGHIYYGARLTLELLLLYKEDGTIALADTKGKKCRDTDALRIECSSEGLYLFSETALTICDTKGKEKGVYPYAEMGLDESDLKILQQHVTGGSIGIMGELRSQYLGLFYGSHGPTVFDTTKKKVRYLSAPEWEDADNIPRGTPILVNGRSDGYTTFSQGSEYFYIPHTYPKDGFALVQGECAAFSDGAIYTFVGKELYPAEEGCTVATRTNVLDTYGYGGVILRIKQNGDASELQCIRDNGKELTLPEDWKTLPEVWHINVLDDILELADATSASYYDMDKGKLVAQFTFD